MLWLPVDKVGCLSIAAFTSIIAQDDLANANLGDAEHSGAS
jgi:hypothetical protein